MGGFLLRGGWHAAGEAGADIRRKPWQQRGQFASGLALYARAPTGHPRELARGESLDLGSCPLHLVLMRAHGAILVLQK
jgi:hypothetical protein